MNRIEKKFSELKAKNQCAFVSYICGGDPNYQTSFEILKNLPAAGVDIIELGVPFLDPSGDGPIIESAAKRAIQNGASLKKTLQMVAEFRKNDKTTPLILMGYYNSFLKYGLDKIFADAESAGTDGILIVDLPFEEESEISTQVARTKILLVNLIAPLTNEGRIKKIAKISQGFLYLISMLGITGTKQATVENSKINVGKIRESCDLPVVVGFGIQTSEQAGEFSKIGADGVVIGSAIVRAIDENFVAKKSTREIVENVIKKVKEFSLAIKE